MPIDNTIALQTQVPSLQNLNNLIGTKQNMMDLQERQSLRGLSQNLDKYKTQDGNLDMNRLTNDAIQIAPKLGSEFAQHIASAHAEGIVVNRSLNQLNDEQRQSIAQALLPVANEPQDVQKKVVSSVLGTNNTLKPVADMFLKHISNAWENGGQEAAKNTIMQLAKGVTTVQTQKDLNTPDYQQAADSRGNPVLFNKNPMVQGGVGSGVVAAGPALGVKENVGGTVDIVNKHYQNTIDEGQKAAQDVGVLQNIKKYAPGAVTGVAGDRRAYMAGLAGLLGMDAEQLSKTKTDLLAKESNMLALAGGDTNLAKMMAESANPNTHMTPEAISKAADRVISMREMAIEKQHYFQNLKNDPQAYNSQISEWNAHADPRVLQYPHMSPQEKQEMRKSMDDREANKFKSDLQWFQDKGILR